MEKVGHNTEKNIQKDDKPGVPYMGSSGHIKPKNLYRYCFFTTK